jgi:aminopeptidase YwaD
MPVPTPSSVRHRRRASALPRARRAAGRTTTVLALAAVFGCTEPGPPPPVACTFDLVEQLDVDRAMGHLEVLAGQIGPRVASSPAEREAAEYLAAELEGMGYDVEIQEFPREGVVAQVEVRAPDGLELHAAAGRVRDVAPADSPVLTPAGGIAARVVDCGEGPCPPEVAGQIALVTPPDGGDAQAVDPETLLAEAAGAGAVAVILHGPDWRRYTVAVDTAPVPFVTVNLDAAQAMREVLAGAEGEGGEGPGTLELTLLLTHHTTSQNVIATRPVEGNPDAPVVIFTAHYDSVEKSPGASDNGSGTVGLLEFARVLRRVDSDFELRFAAVGAEEVGLQGARYYVSQLSESERARIAANFNTDMIGTAGEAQTQLFVNTLDGDNLVARSARAAREALGLPEAMLRAPYQRGASDHVAFADAGIPAANFIWREPETIALEPWYHHPRDRLENVSPERLGTAMQVVLGAALQVICEESGDADAEAPGGGG